MRNPTRIIAAIALFAAGTAYAGEPKQITDKDSLGQGAGKGLYNIREYGRDLDKILKEPVTHDAPKAAPVKCRDLFDR
ncbi:MAG: hypothetical protein JSS36_12275 [Proteobacteria bacterium]|nr:hypothetical protein [Pseudomonadota bacterium]